MASRCFFACQGRDFIHAWDGGKMILEPEEAERAGTLVKTTKARESSYTIILPYTIGRSMKAIILPWDSLHINGAWMFLHVS